MTRDQEPTYTAPELYHLYQMMKDVGGKVSLRSSSDPNTNHPQPPKPSKL